MNQQYRDRKKSSHERKQCYRDLLNRIEGIQETEDVSLNTIKEVGQIFQEVKAIDRQCKFEERVAFADETLLETVILSSASGILVKCFENLDIFQSTYEPAEFALKILNSITQPETEFETKDWLNILEDARSIVPELPSYNFLYGSFDPSKTPVPKQRKEVRRDAQEKVQKKQLQIVQNADKDEEGVDDTVNFLFQVLTDEYEKNDNQPIPYYDFVIDSKSFSSTVENIFYSSFLVRDGKAELSIDENNTPTLQPILEEDLNAFRENGGINSQMITSLSMEDWEDLRSKSGFIQLHRRHTSKT